MKIKILIQSLVNISKGAVVRVNQEMIFWQNIAFFFC